METVLLIEDNADARESMQSVMEAWGLEVTVAADGVDGLKKALTQRPSILIVDIAVPMMDGFEVARRIRASGAPYTPLLIAMTGHSRLEDKQRSLAAGFDLHLVKPVDPDELARILSVGGRI